MASAVAWRLYMANLRSIFMMETAMPLAVRREVSFCEAVHRGSQTVEGVEAVKAGTAEDIPRMWRLGKIAVIIDPEWQTLKRIDRMWSWMPSWPSRTWARAKTTPVW